MLGIDVYERWNHVTDWQAVKSSGVGVVWVKLTDGGGPAAVLGDHYVNGARSVGLPVGGYHFAEATPTPEVQADVFAAELLRLRTLEVAPALDLEASGIVSPETFRERFWRHFRARIQLRRVLTYASASWYAGRLVDAPVIPGEELWVAKYGINDGRDHGAGVPTWDVHQYTSAGLLAGISGRVDLDDVRADVFENPELKEEDMAYPFELPAGTALRESIALSRVRLNEVTVTCDGEMTIHAYGWVSPDGGNGYQEGPISVHDRGAYVLTPPRGTSKIDLQYTANAQVKGVIDAVS